MASKDNSPAISFFSFQDIVTSITGIMFLVVIMLVLMVLQAPASSRKAKEVQQELVELEKVMKQLQDSLTRLRRQAAEQTRRIEELKKLRPEILPELKKEWISKLQNADMMIRHYEDENVQIAEESRELLERRKKALRQIDKNKIEVADLEKELRTLDEELRQKEKIYRKFRNVIRFVWEKSNLKRPILLECSDREIHLNSLDGMTKRRTFANYEECMQFCRTLPPESTYIVLLLKPSSFSYAGKFSNMLQKAGFERGREVLPDEQTLITGDVEK